LRRAHLIYVQEMVGTAQMRLCPPYMTCRISYWRL
jgi:hypothetical protein